MIEEIKALPKRVDQLANDTRMELDRLDDLIQTKYRQFVDLFDRVTALESKARKPIANQAGPIPEGHYTIDALIDALENLQADGWQTLSMQEITELVLN